MDAKRDKCCAEFNTLHGSVNRCGMAVTCNKCGKLWQGRSWEDLRTSDDCCQNWSHYDEEGNHKKDHDGKCPSADQVLEALKIAGIG